MGTDGLSKALQKTPQYLHRPLPFFAQTSVFRRQRPEKAALRRCSPEAWIPAFTEDRRRKARTHAPPLCHVPRARPIAAQAFETLRPELSTQVLAALLLVSERCPELLHCHHPATLRSGSCHYHAIASLFIRLNKIDSYLGEIPGKRRAQAVEMGMQEAMRKYA